MNSGAQKKGLLAELQVIQYLEKKKWELSFHRFKTKIAEVDLILEKENQILLIEVKALKNLWSVFDRYELRQQHSFKANTFLFRNHFKNYHIKSYVAWVCEDGAIQFTLFQ